MNTTGIDFLARAMPSAAVDGLDQEGAVTRTKRSVETIFGQPDQTRMKRARTQPVNAAWTIDSDTLRLLGITLAAQPNVAVDPQSATGPSAAQMPLQPAHEDELPWWNDPTEYVVHEPSSGVQVDPFYALDAENVSNPTTTHDHEDWFTTPDLAKISGEWDAPNVNPPAEAVIASVPAEATASAPIDVSISPEEMDRLLAELKTQPSSQERHVFKRATQEYRDAEKASSRKRAATQTPEQRKKRKEYQQNYRNTHPKQLNAAGGARREKKKAMASQQGPAAESPSA